MRKLPFRLSLASQQKQNQGLPGRIYSEGQALLIVLLIMAVALTIGLSITSRSITDIKISELSEEGARAFSAAEAGIEEALLTLTESGGEVPIGPSATYETKTAGLGEDETEFIFPDKVSSNKPQTLYLATYQADGSLTSPYYSGNTIDVCWEGEGDAALEVTIYYQEAGSYKVARVAVDPIGGRSSGFNSPDVDSCSGVGLSNKKTITLPSGDPLFLRLRTLYASARVGVETDGSTLLSQGIEIDSTGIAGEATRKVSVVKFHPAPLPFFDMVLYSQGGLSK